MLRSCCDILKNTYTFEFVCPLISSPYFFHNTPSWCREPPAHQIKLLRKKIPSQSLNLPMKATFPWKSQPRKCPILNLPTFLYLWPYRLGTHFYWIRCSWLSSSLAHRLRKWNYRPPLQFWSKQNRGILTGNAKLIAKHDLPNHYITNTLLQHASRISKRVSGSVYFTLLRWWSNDDALVLMMI